MIDCKEYVSEFRSCDNNPTIIQLDAEYCATVDHTGRPIGEYGRITNNSLSRRETGARDRYREGERER